MTGPSELTRAQLCRALAAHAIIVRCPEALEQFTAPEFAEGVASFIERFALGELVGRPPPPMCEPE